MKITIKTQAYDQVALTKPFAAIMLFAPDGSDIKPQTWGTYSGALGEVGLLTIEAEKDDIIMVGQSSRTSGGSHPPRRFYRVASAGRLVPFSSKRQAITWFERK